MAVSVLKTEHIHVVVNANYIIFTFDHKVINRALLKKCKTCEVLMFLEESDGSKTIRK